MPQKTRVHLIASVLLVFAGTEVFVLAPYIFDIALMIDVGGLALVLAALRSSVSISMLQLRSLLALLAKPVLLIMKAGEIVGDFGSSFPPEWQRRYFLADRIAGRCGAAFCVAAVGLALTKALITQL